MTSRLRAIPFGVDKILFDGLKFSDLTNTILEYPRYQSRQGRIETGLEAYLSERIINDFVGKKLYSDILNRDIDNDESISDVLAKHGFEISIFNLELYQALLGDLIGQLRSTPYNIDPLLVYMVMSDVVENQWAPSFRIMPNILKFRSSQVLFSLLKILRQWGLLFTQQDIDEFVMALLDTEIGLINDMKELFKNKIFVQNLQYYPSVIYSIIKYALAPGIYSTRTVIDVITYMRDSKRLDKSDYKILVDIVANIFREILTEWDIIYIVGALR